MDKRRWSGDRIRDYTAERSFSEADSHILTVLNRLNPETVVEIGCGSGIIFRRSPSINSYISTDFTHGFLKAAVKSCPGTPAVCCQGSRLPFAEGSVDCVLAMTVLHHLSSESLQKAIHEVHRILKAGGHLVLLEDWCFSAGATAFEEEARKIRFKYGTGENHLASGTWLYLLENSGFCRVQSEWVNRPFCGSDRRLLKWPESQRTVRMCCFTGMKSL